MAPGMLIERSGVHELSLFVLIPLSIGMGSLGLGAFVWALKNDQFEDPDGNASRVLMNDMPAEVEEQNLDA